MEIEGDVLRVVADKPTIGAPLMCQLYSAEFVYDDDFNLHETSQHAGKNEYRKRMLYPLQYHGCRPVTVQGKRQMVQN